MVLVCLGAWGVSLAMPTSDAKTPAPVWMRRVLLAAAVYNLLWGAWVVLFPNGYFHLAGMEPLNHPQIWQCVGMIVGVYGIGYGIAAFDPFRHWPIVLVGLLGKVLGPIGFAHALWTGAFPWQACLTTLSNDLIWWIPFALILAQTGLYHSTRHYVREEPMSVSQALASATLSDGLSLLKASYQKPLLLVFTRHYG